MFQVDGVCDGELRRQWRFQDDNWGVFSLDFILGVFLV